MRGNAALAIWFRVDAADIPELDAWYPGQHLPERLSVPGFLRGRRYAAASARLPYFTLYETEEVAVLSSAPYLERLNNPNAWTRRALPTLRVMVRGAYRRLGAGADDRVERHMLTVQVKPDSGRGPYVREWLEGQASSALGAFAGVAGVACYLSDAGGTTVVTEERKIVGGEVAAGAPFLALVEVADPGAESALREFWERWARKMAAEAIVDFYRLMYGLSWL